MKRWQMEAQAAKNLSNRKEKEGLDDYKQSSAE